MADGITIDVRGVDELDQLLTQFAGPIADNAMANGVLDGAKIFQQAITDAAPIRPDLPSGTALPVGKLKRSIQIRGTKLKTGEIACFVEPSADVRHVAVWVEFGHRIVKGGRSKKGKGGGYVGNGREVGSVPPHPFVRPSFEASEGAAINAVQNRIIQDLSAEAETASLDLEDLESDD